MGVDWEAEGLLDGLDDEASRRGRIELLEQLSEEGLSLEELRRAAADGRLALLPVERNIEGRGPRYTAAEVAERSGLETEFLDRVWRALGLALADPDEHIYTEADVEAARRIKLARDAGISDDSNIELTRAMGQGMAGLAAVMMRIFGESFLREGDTERDLSARFAEAASGLSPLLAPALEHVFNLHLREQLRRAAVADEQLRSGRLQGAQDIAVCFADLVGFTRFGERASVEELEAVVERLGDLAADVVEPPVRLVKTIGDAAMLVSPETAPLLEATLSLVDAADAEGDDFPRLRAGLARGEALLRAGDWYGRPVNLASRITSFARPGSVVASEDAKLAAEDSYAWSFAGRRRFKGVQGDVAVFRVRRQ